MSKSQFNAFIFLKLPIAWIAGIRLQELNQEKATIKVRLHWLNQNPFKSMFWAVQGMAAELSTGVMCVTKIKEKKVKISMLVIEQNAIFTKKAKGKITFTCTQGKLIDQALQKAIDSKEPQTLWLESTGIDAQNATVAHFKFLWSFKVNF